MTDGTDPSQDGVSPDGGTEPVGPPSDSTRTVTRSREGPPAEATDRSRQEFLLEAVRRAPILGALRSGPATASDLLAAVDVSRSTLHRATDSLADLDLVENVDGVYQLTSLGRIIADEAEAFATRSWTGLTIKQFLNAINGSGTDVPLEHLSDATITKREPRQPHVTIHRIINLIESAESLRMFSTVISPVYVDVGYREMMDGMRIEAIFDREVADLMLREYPQKAHDTISTGNFQVFTHEGLPFELFLTEDKIGMAAHDDTGNAEVLIECDDPAAVAWAEDLYERHRENAFPVVSDDI